MFYRVSNNTYYDYYTIEKGDTLYKIGKEYNINPKLLATLNGLDMDDYIYPGQVLLVPKNEYSYYITKEGDTIDSVANTLGISKENLLNENETIYLMEGQMIVKNKSK